MMIHSLSKPHSTDNPPSPNSPALTPLTLDKSCHSVYCTHDQPFGLVKLCQKGMERNAAVGKERAPSSSPAIALEVGAFKNVNLSVWVTTQWAQKNMWQ